MNAFREMTAEEKEIAQKRWEDITLEQKVERLRAILLGFEHLPMRVDSLVRDMGMLKKHQHAPDGSLVAPILQTGESAGGLLGAKLNPPYNSLY